MEASTLQEIAGTLALAGAWGTVAMLLYRAALRRVDWDLIPASAMPRVRWWSSRASCLLRMSLITACFGLTALTALAVT